MQAGVGGPSAVQVCRRGIAGGKGGRASDDGDLQRWFWEGRDFDNDSDDTDKVMMVVVGEEEEEEGAEDS